MHFASAQPEDVDGWKEREKNNARSFCWEENAKDFEGSLDEKDAVSKICDLTKKLQPKFS